MRILIVEQDKNTIESLKKMLGEIIPGLVIAGITTSVQETFKWFRSNKVPDLIFSTVELPDGLSFQIFKELRKRVPVIFICRDQHYAIDAFKANGIFYILKPLNRQDLEDAVKRFEDDYSCRSCAIKTVTRSHHQERFLISLGQQLKLIKATEIAYFYTENKVVYLITFDGNKYLSDFTLERLEQLLNPTMFFRINRQFIINIAAIVKLEHATKSRFQVFLRPKTAYTTITSFGRKENFCKWMIGELQTEDLTVEPV